MEKEPEKKEVNILIENLIRKRRTKSIKWISTLIISAILVFFIIFYLSNYFYFSKEQPVGDSLNLVSLEKNIKQSIFLDNYTVEIFINERNIKKNVRMLKFVFQDNNDKDKFYYYYLDLNNETKSSYIIRSSYLGINNFQDIGNISLDYLIDESAI